jgi:cytochrome c-type biogenesis protein CcmE
MTNVKTKLAIAGIVLAAAVTYLVASGVRSGWVYYLQVDQFLQQADYHDQRVRLAGLVAEDNLHVDTAALLARFEMIGLERNLTVEYNGVIPDNFQPGIEAVVEGRLGDDGVFRAATLMTKCASKYEEAGAAGESHPDAIPRIETQGELQ